MKFSVAPESTRAMASALFAIEWTKNRSVIDFRADKYTSPLLPCLISADLIRQLENPHLFPSLLPRHLVPGGSCLSTAALLTPCYPVAQGLVGCQPIPPHCNQ